MSVEMMVFLLLIVFVLGVVLEEIGDRRRTREANQALRELMEAAKSDDERGRQAKMLLMVWATTPPMY